jgi:hypothetical protein
MTWPINTEAALRETLALGVTGVISDELGCSNGCSGTECQATSAGVPPVTRSSSSYVVGKTVLGWPAAAQTCG